ncbi:MAG: HlyD family secretion protein [Verrucomicrobia bacterium]|nr:HlyD family secretion protein [Verrucomicrobiota bacterium]
MTRRLFNIALTLAVVGIAGFAAWTLYQRYIATPWTRDCQVRANVVGIAPRISGPIIRVAVKDNQEVKRGDLLFEIDPADYQAQVNVARGQLLNAEANLKQRQQDMARQTDLYERKVNTLQDYQNAQDALAAADAQVTSAKANLDLAQLNLGYTRITAPVDGFVTNMNISPGTYVSAGKQLTALVDTGSFWIAAYFKETQLPSIKVGQKARITIMGDQKHPLEGEVRSVGWGIFVQDGSPDPSGLLPAISQTVDWVRLPQRFPVRIQLGPNPGVPLRIGQTASVVMLPIAASADKRSPSEPVVRP